MSNRSKKYKDDCGICYGCGWVINDDIKTPFYDTTFADLATGDELIRCWECNAVDLSGPLTAKKAKPVSGSRYKAH